MTNKEEPDDDSIKDRRQTRITRKTIQYMFDGDAEFSGPFEEIDLNDLINWNEINDKALKEMKG